MVSGTGSEIATRLVSGNSKFFIIFKFIYLNTKNQYLHVVEIKLIHPSLIGGSMLL